VGPPLHTHQVRVACHRIDQVVDDARPTCLNVHFGNDERARTEPQLHRDFEAIARPARTDKGSPALPGRAASLHVRMFPRRLEDAAIAQLRADDVQIVLGQRRAASVWRLLTLRPQVLAAGALPAQPIGKPVADDGAHPHEVVFGLRGVDRQGHCVNEAHVGKLTGGCHENRTWALTASMRCDGEKCYRCSSA
jgi:hypothetical protein